MTLAERQRAAATRLNYPPGTRLVLISMDNDPIPIPTGTRGTVLGVDDAGSIMMRWDNSNPHLGHMRSNVLIAALDRTYRPCYNLYTLSSHTKLSIFQSC